MGKFLFRIARLKIMGTFIGFVFAYLPFLVPVKKIMLNRKAVSFMHPSAVYPNHVLIIPRKIARTIFNLSSEDFIEVIEMATKIRDGDSRDFALVINGGKRQDVMQAHFHLFTGNLSAREGISERRRLSFLESDNHIGVNLLDTLRQHDVSEMSFSMIIQFEKDAEPVVFFT